MEETYATQQKKFKLKKLPEPKQLPQQKQLKEQFVKKTQQFIT